MEIPDIDKWYIPVLQPLQKQSIPMPWNNNYYMAYHFEKADLFMELSFNKDGLINGFFITSILPKCETKKIKMVAIGKEEYFIEKTEVLKIIG